MVSGAAQALPALSVKIGFREYIALFIQLPLQARIPRLGLQGLPLHIQEGLGGHVPGTVPHALHRRIPVGACHTFPVQSEICLQNNLVLFIPALPGRVSAAAQHLLALAVQVSFAGLVLSVPGPRGLAQHGSVHVHALFQGDMSFRVQFAAHHGIPVGEAHDLIVRIEVHARIAGGRIIHGAGIGVFLPLHVHDLSVHVGILCHGHRAAGIVLQLHVRVPAPGVHRREVRAEIVPGNMLVLFVEHIFHPVIAFADEHGLAGKIVALRHHLLVLVLQHDLVIAFREHKGRIVRSEEFLVRGIAVGVIDVPDAAVAFRSGHRVSLGIQIGLTLQHALLVVLVDHLGHAVHVLHALLVGAEIAGGHEPVVAVVVAHHGVSQALHHHEVILFVVIALRDDLAVAGIGAVHARIAVGDHNALRHAVFRDLRAVRISVVGQGLDPVPRAQLPAQSAVFVLHIIGGSVRVKVQGQGGGVRRIGNLYIGIPVRSGDQLAVLALPCFIGLFAIGIFDFIGGILELRVHDQAALGIIVGSALVVLAGIDGLRVGIPFRSRHVIAFRVIVGVANLGAPSAETDVLRHIPGPKALGTDQVALGIQMLRLIDEHAPVIAHLTGIAFRPDDIVAVLVLVCPLRQLPLGGIGKRQGMVSLHAVGGIPLLVIIGSLHQGCLPRIGVAHLRISEVRCHHRVPVLIHIDQPGHLTLAVVGARHLQILGHLGHGRDREKHAQQSQYSDI